MPILLKSQRTDEAKALMKSHEQLWDKQNQFRQTGESLRKLILPNQSEIDLFSSIQGQERTNHVYDSTATMAAPRFAAHLAGNVTPSRIQSFDFEAPTHDLDSLSTEAKNWLQDEPKSLFAAQQESNYFGEILKFWLDVVVFGTGAMFSDEHPHRKGGFFFHTVPFGSYALDESIVGLIARFDRRFDWPLSRIVERWGLENVHPIWQAHVKQDPFQVKRIIQVTRLAQDIDRSFGVPQKRAVATYYIDPEHAYILEVGSYHEMPYQVGRWYQAAGEDLGRGCGHDVLADIRSKNEITRLALNNLALSVHPPWAARHEGVLGQPIVRPNSLTWVMQQGDLAPMPNQARLDIQAYGQDQLANSINRAFFQDIINVTQQLPQGKTPISATQINENIDRMLPIIGPYLSKIEHEFILPQLTRLFNIRVRAGQVQPLPGDLQELFSARGGVIHVNIKGPIAKAIKKTNLDSMDAVMTRAMSVSQLYPELRHEFNIGRTARLWVEGENAPIEILNTEEEKQDILEQEAQAAAEAQEDQGIKDASEVIKNVGDIPRGV